MDGRSAADVWEARDRLGSGSSSTVFLAVDRCTNEFSAVKLSVNSSIAAPLSSAARAVALLRHERRILEEMGQHEHCVRQLDFFESAGSPSAAALVLEYLPGGDCQQLLQQHGALPERTVREMMSQLHSALRFVHSQSILHRDVKLENVLCSHNPLGEQHPRVVLCDFGHAVRMEELSEQKMLFCGTEGYAAPEVSLPRTSRPHWTYAADVWGLGVVMCAPTSYTASIGRPLP